MLIVRPIGAVGVVKVNKGPDLTVAIMNALLAPFEEYPWHDPVATGYTVFSASEDFNTQASFNPRATAICDRVGIYGTIVIVENRDVDDLCDLSTLVDQKQRQRFEHSIIHSLGRSYAVYHHSVA